jgi:pterin-4a-carbinolamine dehydratase
VYANVTIRLSTHDLGGISTLDLTLAEAIDRLL